MKTEINDIVSVCGSNAEKAKELAKKYAVELPKRYIVTTVCDWGVVNTDRLASRCEEYGLDVRVCGPGDLNPAQEEWDFGYPHQELIIHLVPAAGSERFLSEGRAFFGENRRQQIWLFFPETLTAEATDGLRAFLHTSQQNGETEQILHFSVNMPEQECKDLLAAVITFYADYRYQTLRERLRNEQKLWLQQFQEPAPELDSASYSFIWPELSRDDLYRRAALCALAADLQKPAQPPRNADQTRSVLEAACAEMLGTENLDEFYRENLYKLAAYLRFLPKLRKAGDGDKWEAQLYGDPSSLERYVTLNSPFARKPDMETVERAGWRLFDMLLRWGEQGPALQLGFLSEILRETDGRTGKNAAEQMSCYASDLRRALIRNLADACFVWLKSRQRDPLLTQQGREQQLDRIYRELHTRQPAPFPCEWHDPEAIRQAVQKGVEVLLTEEYLRDLPACRDESPATDLAVIPYRIVFQGSGGSIPGIYHAEGRSAIPGNMECLTLRLHRYSWFTYFSRQEKADNRES